MGSHEADSSSRVISGLAFDPDDARHSHALRCFGRQLAKLDDAIAASANEAPPEGSHLARPFLEQTAIGHRLYLAGGRTPLFMLQGLARLEIGTRKSPETFEKALRHIKRLEDELGEVDFWWTLFTRGAAWGLPAGVVNWAESHHAHACGQAEGWLEASDWIAHKGQPEEGTIRLRTNKLSRALVGESWSTARKAKNRLGKFLVEKLRKTHEAALELNMQDLEGGVHELRRKVRWFSIYAAALEGALTLDRAAEAPAGWERYMAERVVTSPFNQLPAPPEGVDPLFIPAPLFYALSCFIGELGDIKDAAQWTEAIEAGLKVTGEAGSPEQFLGEQAVSHEVAGQRAAAVVAQTIVADALLPRLADALEAQLG